MRVTKITQGTSVVQIGYDGDGRRTSLTLPNGIIANYAYDAASQLTGITYTQSGVPIGDLEYTYDSGGRVATVGGSLAHINLPQPVSGLVYDADNRLSGFGGSQFVYDNNGNVTSDGTHSYTWDARNHLVAIDGGSTASFVYGPFGRRISKTVYGVSTGFLYDGSNVVQELSGTTPSANLLSGGQDEVFTRTDSSGVADFLRDGIGNTAELTDSTGAALQSYTYSPNGFTSTNGGSANSYQYLGRETDATGLYEFRNRYYNPITERFLSEDPIGLAGGPNLYEYGADNPVTYRDPSGKVIGEGCLMGVAAYEFGQVMRGLAGRKMDSGWNEAKGAAAACASGFLFEGALEWAEAFSAVPGAFADGLEGLGPDAMDAEQMAANCGMCFAAGTPVETRHGRVPIEKIKVGDEVLARNMATGKLEYRKVIALTRPHQDHLLELKIEGEHAAIEATPSHPFWVKRAGKAAGWITAGKMHPGDQVLTQNRKWEKVTEDISLNKLATVYNFEVQDDHDYFVGKSGILVHNIGPCAFGTQMHQGFRDYVAEQTNTDPGQWTARTAPGQTGPDLEWKGPGPSPLGNGINYAELKPSSPSGLGKFFSQIWNWGTEGQTALFTYGPSGVYSPWFTIW